MKIRLILASLCISTTLMAVSFAGQSADPWQAVGDGISYREFHLTDPELNDVYVARMDRSNSSAILDSGIAQGRISYGTEKVSEMFKRYDEAINYWGESWGKRNKVVVAINGSYFHWSGVPESGQITSGWYAKRFTDLGGSSGFGFQMDRSMFIGQCVNHEAARQVLSIVRGGQTLRTMLIDGVNTARADNQLILYTPQYNDYTPNTNNGLEVLVEMTRPTLIISHPAAAIGTVRKIFDLQGKTLIPFDHVVLSASGGDRTQLLANLRSGDEVHISQEITSYDKDCGSSYPLDWKKTYASVSGGFNNLREGQIIPTTETGGLIKAPRTAIAFNEQYVFYIVVDGRNPQRSVGMTYDELAAFARDTLGATWATTQDGGGSSVMVVNGQVKNHPVSLCENFQYLPLIQSKGSPSQLQVLPTIAPSPTPSDPDSPALAQAFYACERQVANSMMMINLQPALKSQTFRPSDQVYIQSASNLRLGPGTNYASFANLAAGSQGVILPHAANLNGISAKGTSWWKAAFGNTEGWIDERSILLKTR